MRSKCFIRNWLASCWRISKKFTTAGEVERTKGYHDRNHQQIPVVEDGVFQLFEQAVHCGDCEPGNVSEEGLVQEEHRDHGADDGKRTHYCEQIKKDGRFLGSGFRSFHLTWILIWFGCSCCRCDLVRQSTLTQTGLAILGFLLQPYSPILHPLQRLYDRFKYSVNQLFARMTCLGTRHGTDGGHSGKPTEKCTSDESF